MKGIIVTLPSGNQYRVLGPRPGGGWFVEGLSSTVDSRSWMKGDLILKYSKYADDTLPLGYGSSPLKVVAKKCICGCAVIGVSKHSDWCDLYSE